MNLSFEALDRHVIAGRAAEPALRGGGRDWDFARLLEEVATLAGAMRGLGVAPGARVVVTDASPRTRLLACLAALRLGAVPVLDGDPATATLLVAATPPPADAAVPAVIVEGDGAVVESRDWALELALRAGRTDPAAPADPPPGAPSYVVGDTEVREPEVESVLGAALAALVAGRPVDVPAPDGR